MSDRDASPERTATLPERQSKAREILTNYNITALVDSDEREIIDDFLDDMNVSTYVVLFSVYALFGNL